MHPDRDILEVEKRLVRRRHEMDVIAHEAGRAAKKKLASPLVLVGAAALGFLVVGGVRRRRRVVAKQPEGSAAKKTGIAGLLMTGAMWLIRARFGTPMAFAEYVLAKVKARRAAASPFSDSGELEAGGRRLHSRPAQIYR